MKLDTGKAWSDAVDLISKNRDVVLAVGGLLFFMPGFAAYVLFPESMAGSQTPAPPGGSFDDAMAAMQAAMIEQAAGSWYITLPLTLLQWLGTLVLMALLLNRDRPTVGQAIGIGGRGLLPYVLAQLLFVVAISLAIGLPLGLVTAVGGGFVAALLVIVAFPLVVYAFVKIMLLPAVIANEGIRNPVAAIKRSWGLTKGNSLTLFFFIFLLTLAAGVVAILVSLVFVAVFAAFGGMVETIGSGFVQSAISAMVAIVLLAAIAAVYRQLSAPESAEVSETFD